MKKNPGRRERRRIMTSNRKMAGRDRMKWNNWMTKHPNDSRQRKKVAE